MAVARQEGATGIAIDMLKAVNAASMLSQPQTALPWPAHVARYTYNMESLVFLSSDWLKTACVLSALFWVAYRAYQVLSKPVEELVALLGLEVPVAPVVSLAGIRADGVLLHWKPPEQRASVVKYVIRINGIDIGDVSPHETSVTIENLQPDHHYAMRIVTVNSANFQAPSAPIRLRTLPAASALFYSTAPQKDPRDAPAPDNEDDEFTPTPIIRPNKNLLESTAPATAAPVVTREHSNSISRMRRSEPSRRNSPASQTADQARSAHEAADSIESIKQLTAKLDGMRREIDDVEKQIEDEDDDYQAQKAALSEKRDEKKTALKEKEDASRDLRKEVATLERANAQAQTRRAQQERLLRQTEQERKKLKDDTARWEREAVELRAAADAAEKERAEYESASALRIQALKEKYAEEIQTNKSLEEVIREKGTLIKTLEEERKNLEESEDGGDVQEGTEHADAEDDRQWMETLNALQQSYANAWSVFSQAERANQEAANRLHYLQQRRLSQPQLFAGTPLQEPVSRRRNSQRSRPVSVREPFLSAVPGGFTQSSGPSFNSSISNVSPTMPNATRYFNINNGMALQHHSHNMSSLSQGEIDTFTGGAPMSPTAGALLPSGLFGDDSGLTDAEYDERDHGHGPPQGSMDPSPHQRHVLPGLGAPGTFEPVQSPSSPVSVQSHSPGGMYPSPRDSGGHLGYFPPPNEYANDSDRRSLRSTSSTNPPVNTRFSSLFGLNRQRGKTLSDQGPPLGSLKPSQSQSLPRQDAGDLDPMGTQLRRGSHEGPWYTGLLRSSKTQPIESSNSPKHVASRKRPFNMFGSKGDPWLASALGPDERPPSPRQGSTNSGEATTLPRPSTESHARFGWSVDAFSAARNSPLGVDWSMNNTSSWSRMPSRRPSVQHGSTASLINEQLLQGGTPDFPTTFKSPTQAPIGTRPQSSASHRPPIPPTPPKALNPAAPQFQSVLPHGDKSDDDEAEKGKRAAEKAADKEAKKAEKKEEKAARKEREKQLALESAANDYAKDGYALDARRSRDNRSISTADYSEASPRESMERSFSLASSDPQGGAYGKETFMQKLSRKSSSSQFLGFGKTKASLFSKKPEAVMTPEYEEEGVLGGRTVDSSATNSPSIGTTRDKSSALSWSSIKRMGKRGDKAPSESIASETTGDEDEESAA